MKPIEEPRSSDWRDPTDLTMLAMIGRRPLVFCCVLAVCVAGAWAYLHRATPLYNSVARLRVQPSSAQPFGNAEPARSGEEMSAFLNAELAVLTSTPVLESALGGDELRGRNLFGGSMDAVGGLRRDLRAAVGRKDGIISVEYEAPSADDAAAVVRAVVEAYVAFESRQKAAVDGKLLAMLTAEKAGCAEAIREKTEQMSRILRAAGTVALNKQDKAQELAALRGNLRAAQLDVHNAESQYKGAVGALEGDAGLLAQLDRLKAMASVPVNGDVESSQMRLAITELELKKQDLMGTRGYLASNPQVVGVQRQLDRLRLMYAASAYERWLQVHDRAALMQVAVREQEVAAQDLADKEGQYAQAEMELKRLDRRADVLDERIKEIMAREGAGALHIAVVEPARAAVRPVKPDAPRIFAMAVVLGLLLGGAAAIAIEKRWPRRAMVEQPRQDDASDDMASHLRVRRQKPAMG